MSSRSQSTAENLARAETALERQRLIGTISFTSVRKALAWAFEAATIRDKPRSPLGFTPPRDYKGEPCIVRVEGGRHQDPEEALVTMFSIMSAFYRFSSMEPAKGQAVVFTIRDGMSQELAGRRLNVDQGTVSRWVSDCDNALLQALLDAEIVR